MDNKLTQQSYEEQFKIERMKEEKNNEDATVFSLKLWWNKVQCSENIVTRIERYEQGLYYIPGCYKLWWNYLQDLEREVGDLQGMNLIRKEKAIEKVAIVYERSLIFMHKMPRIWIMYAQWMIKTHQYNKVRQVFDRALLSLPLSQHDKIWTIYLEWLLQQPNVQMVTSVMDRYLILRPDHKENIIPYFIDNQHYDRAVSLLKSIIDDDQYVSHKDTSKYELTVQMCQLISKYGQEITSVDCNKVIRHGIRKYTDEVGNLWVCLAEYFIRQGLFDKARDVFEEALESIYTVRDFGIIFNAYLKFEEEFISLIDYHLIQQTQSDNHLQNYIDQLLGLNLNDNINEQQQLQQENQDKELEIRIERLERLLSRRALLISNCVLRKNRHNVEEWLKRFDLLVKDQQQLIASFSQALTQVDNEQTVNGSASQIWLYIAKYYREHNDISNSNAILHKAIQQKFKSYQDYLILWKYWVETLIKESMYSDAQQVLKKALFTKNIESLSNFNDSIRLSTDLWALYVDLELNLGTVETIRTTYQKMIDLKVITPLMTINYIDFLENHHYFEQSYKIFEQAISIFNHNSSYMLFVNYLYKFIERYQGTKLERTRDLFEKAIATHHTQKLLYLMYGQFEEQYGLLNHAIEIYDRMAKNISQSFFAYQLYITKVAQYLGITKTRPVFEKALENLIGDEMIQMGINYSKLEIRLGEIERARSILTHICQYVSIVDDSVGIWNQFEEFEKKHGNMDTYKDFLRVKRAVSVKFSLNPPDVNRILQKIQREEELIQEQKLQEEEEESINQQVNLQEQSSNKNNKNLFKYLNPNHIINQQTQQQVM